VFGAYFALLEIRFCEGPLLGGATATEGRVAFLPAPSDGDFAAAVESAAASGASAVLFEADRAEPRPFGYRHDQEAPKLPAAMVSRALAARVKAALEAGSSLSAQITIAEKDDEEAEEMDQGLVSAFIAEDVVEDEVHRQLKSLREERERCKRALRFARQMRALLEQNEAHCPVCFQAGDEAEAFAVMPDCFHVLCRACLDRQVGHESFFACPLCRTNVARLDVVVFRAPGCGCRAAEEGGNERRQGRTVAVEVQEIDQQAGPRESLEGITLELEDEAAAGNGETGRTSAATDAAPAERGVSGNEGEQAEEEESSADRNLRGWGLTREGVAEDTNVRAWEALPSKLQRLLDLLRELLASGPEERVLVFTQWAVHVAHLRDVLEQHGVEALALVGELRETMAALSRFGRPEEPRVLLLSSQRHSSGINLQAARHVIIVHPYCTPTLSSRECISRQQMLAFEEQAVGRVRRYPQNRPVHVYRLFAAGTVEEELYAVR